MDPAFLALLYAAYEAYKAKKAAGDDNPDAIIETILPELARHFAVLFKNNPDGLFEALNAFALNLYHVSGDEFQLVLRLMANMKLERLQSRHPWISLPFLLLFKGYLNALEEATKSKDKPTRDDIKAAAEKVTAEAKKAGSKFEDMFNKAKAAAKDMKIPHFDKPPGGSMPPHAPPPPSGGTAAGGTGNRAKINLAEMAHQAKEAWGILTSLIGWAADRSEDHVQSAANGAFWAAVAVIMTIVTSMVSVFIDSNFLMAINIVSWSAAWTIGPFIFLWRWRNHNRRIHEKQMAKAKADGAEVSPYEKAGNGFLEIGATSGAAAFVGLVSTIVVATLCALGAYSNFHVAYVWSGLTAIGAAFFAYILLDVSLDTMRAIGQMIPNEFAQILEARNRAARSFSLVGVIFGLLMLGPVLVYLFRHTDYEASSAVLGIYLALMAGFANTRLGNEAGSMPPETIKDIWAEFVRRNFKSAQRILLGSALVIAANVALDHLILPPQCPNKDGDADTADVCEAGELPSYAERWRKSRVPKIGANVAEKAMNALDPNGNCSPEVVQFTNSILENDCKAVLRGGEGNTPEAIRLCNEGVSCGLLKENGSKKPAAARKVGPRDAGFNWLWFGIPAALALVLGLVLVFRKDPAATEKKEEKKGPAAH